MSLRHSHKAAAVDMMAFIETWALLKTYNIVHSAAKWFEKDGHGQMRVALRRWGSLANRPRKKERLSGSVSLGKHDTHLANVTFQHHHMWHLTIGTACQILLVGVGRSAVALFSCTKSRLCHLQLPGHLAGDTACKVYIHIRP